MYPEFEGHPLRKDYPADQIQPLVPYREVDDIDKLPPFGPDEGMPLRAADARPCRREDDGAEDGRPITAGELESDGTAGSRARRGRARAAERADAAQHGPVAPGDARHGAHRARALGRDIIEGATCRSATCTAASRRCASAGPGRRSSRTSTAATTSRRCSTTWASRSRSRRCSASTVPERCQYYRIDPRRARAHLRPPDLQRRDGDGARRVHAVPLCIKAREMIWDIFEEEATRQLASLTSSSVAAAIRGGRATGARGPGRFGVVVGAPAVLPIGLAALLTRRRIGLDRVT